ncbi:hypothetical protein [Pseudomonas phage vB_PaeM_PS119XW]|uniref:Uncharacterized protein n=1 Tax=Pseudomonas phage vB_PaeM_PS119XW TaxID=2601632 RepID=A0A5C1K8Y3_9CAUD|nr:hypothetical protein PP933_gp075 [Pseudomonas phage vB_PaeM_PS119XW]QEM41804.1 hypothetical protein [Pseudomonas phage vB_PaeM_PS119XW]
MAIITNVFAFAIITLFIVFFLKQGLAVMGVKTNHLPIKLAKAFNASGPLAAILLAVYLIMATFL